MVDWNGQAWCAQHQSHPMDCWEIHNAGALDRVGEASADGEISAAERHTTLQLLNGYEPSKGFEVVTVTRTKTIRASGKHQ